MYYISRLIRSCDLSIYSFKKWQRLTRTFDKKIEMQTTTKESVGAGPGREETKVSNRKLERRVNSMSKRGKTEMRGRVVHLPQLTFKLFRVCCSSKNSKYRLSCHAR